MKKKITLSTLAQQVSYIKGYQKGFDTCKEIYSKYVILPKCYACDNIGDQNFTHTYGTEPACSKHASEINPEIVKIFPLRYK